MPKRRSERRSAPRPGSATHGYRKPGYETTTRRPSRHCNRTWARNFTAWISPLQRRYPTESDQCLTGKFTSRWPGTLAPVSTTGPGALTSSSASTKPVIPIPKKDVRRDVWRRDRGQRPTATKDPNTKQRRRRPSRHCSRVRRPRFPHLAFGPHPSRQWLRNRFSADGPIPNRRSERRSAPRPGSATPATENPDPKRLRGG